MTSQLKIFWVLCPLLVYGTGAWVLRSMLYSPAYTVSDVYLGQMLLFGTVLVSYFSVLPILLRGNAISLRAGILLALVAPLAIPSVMQTDQLRYIWDGINQVRGWNPYGLTPVDHPEFRSVWWVGLINFPNLPTIYPAFAQVVFAAAAVLNPFFWQLEQGSLVVNPGLASSLWQVEFGLSLVQGVVAAWTVWLLRKRRWALVLFNPLFLICAVGNLHLDAMLLPLMVLALFGSLASKGRMITSAMAFAAAVSLKWMPMIWLPYFYLSRKDSYRSRFLHAFLCLAGVGFGLYYFSPEILEALQTSTSSFVSEWKFFAFGFFWLKIE